MNKCMAEDIQELLPDMLHDTLAAEHRARVEAHLATCGECREELAVLRTVKSAAVFVPAIDVNGIVRQIPPYQTIIPAVERPARPRAVSWLVAASLAIVVAAGGSVLMTRGPSSVERTVVAIDSPVAVSRTAVIADPESVASVSEPITSTPPAHTYAFALATDVDGLSDGSLVQLMSDMNEFDALPASDPEPMISVDSVENIGQD